MLCIIFVLNSYRFCESARGIVRDAMHPVPRQANRARAIEGPTRETEESESDKED